MELQNQGQIESVIFPDEWVQTDYSPDSSTMAEGVIFAHRDDPEVSIRIYRPGTMTGTDVGEKFLELLEMPPHNLDETELLYMAVAARGMGNEDAFEADYTRTEVVQGKTVLSMKGVWKKKPPG